MASTPYKTLRIKHLMGVSSIKVAAFLHLLEIDLNWQAAVVLAPDSDDITCLRRNLSIPATIRTKIADSEQLAPGMKFFEFAPLPSRRFESRTSIRPKITPFLNELLLEWSSGFIRKSVGTLGGLSVHPDLLEISGHRKQLEESMHEMKKHRLARPVQLFIDEDRIHQFLLPNRSRIGSLSEDKTEYPQTTLSNFKTAIAILTDRTQPTFLGYAPEVSNQIIEFVNQSAPNAPSSIGNLIFAEIVGIQSAHGMQYAYLKEHPNHFV